MKFLQQRLLRMWQPTGSKKMIDLENDYYLIRFSNLEDVGKRVAVWVRIPALPIEHYDKNILWRIGSSLGHMMKIDQNTLRERSATHYDEFLTERAKFAIYMCGDRLEEGSGFMLPIEQQDNQVVGTEAVENSSQARDIEGQVGGDGVRNGVGGESGCGAGGVEHNSEVFGAWMIALRKSRRYNQNQRNLGDKGQSAHIKIGVEVKAQGSRFVALQVSEDVPLGAHVSGSQKVQCDNHGPQGFSLYDINSEVGPSTKNFGPHAPPNQRGV
ncbi:hypothetical protein SESBI_40414 [Sesbania bispinosa]|nr:hypothetical protein SESBI_40414 [Sesbania bispinosa]